MPRVLIRLAFVCLVALPLALPGAAAHANSHQTMSFEAPRELVDPSQRDQAFDKIQSLGASSLRVILYWQDVAPDSKSARRPSGFNATDPTQYDWSRYDPILTGAARRGWPVILTVTGPVPKWATASKKDNVTRPSAKEFKAFMTALGKHYGSQVNTWAIWNEPNHPDFLQPQFSKRHKPLSPRIYRQLFLGAWRGLRAAGQGRDRMLMGETAPRGTGAVVAPLTFLRGALCLSSHYVKRRACSNLPADGYAHHAYSTRLGPFFKPPGPNDVTIGVLNRLVRALDRAAAAGAIKRGMGIYLTEFGIQSKPDPFYGVSLAQQAEYYAISERIAYRNSRVRSFSQYLLRDDDPGCCGGRYGGFESGLEYASGKIKRPAYDGFRLPLVAARSGRRVSLWGRVRPARARTTAEILVADKGKGFHKLRSVRTDTRGVWTTRTRYRKGRRWRLRWKDAQGTVFTGPPIRSYSSRGKVG